MLKLLKLNKNLNYSFIGFILALLLVSSLFLACNSSSDGSSTKKKSNTNQTNNVEPFPALGWDGVNWVNVDWNQITFGLSDLEKSLIRKQGVAKSNNFYFKKVKIGTTGAGVSIDELYRSDDAGATWELVIAAQTFHPAIAHIYANGSTVYVVTYNFHNMTSTNSSILLISEDEGDNWQVVMDITGIACDGQIGDITYYAETGDYYAVFPRCYGVTNLDTDEESLFSNGTSIGSLVSAGSSMYAITWGDVYESSDGRNWNEMSMNTDIEELAVYNGKLYGFF